MRFAAASITLAFILVPCAGICSQQSLREKPAAGGRAASLLVKHADVSRGVSQAPADVTRSTSLLEGEQRGSSPGVVLPQVPNVPFLQANAWASLFSRGWALVLGAALFLVWLVGCCSLAIQKFVPELGKTSQIVEAVVNCAACNGLAATAVVGAVELRGDFGGSAVERLFGVCEASAFFLVLAMAYYGLRAMLEVARGVSDGKSLLLLQHGGVVAAACVVLHTGVMHFYACFAGCCLFGDSLQKNARALRMIAGGVGPAPYSWTAWLAHLNSQLLQLWQVLRYFLAVHWLALFVYDLRQCPEAEYRLVPATVRVLCPALLAMLLAGDALARCARGAADAARGPSVEEVLPQIGSEEVPLMKPGRGRFGRPPREILWALR
eukprot:TRINITY_DN75521_c0_g1_i1.p1 TRINITY_DN75521_c0_g1~~TRINITY_DN75521_c0_g1_i1.p1  ORF type:complete len:380 (+),score=64.79 TRINITY_DN75521_c0_g1_i1:142-1281(+)